MPWAGIQDSKNPLRRASASKRSMFGMKELIEDGYKTYSKHDRAFVLPNLVTGPEVILPMSQLMWLLNQPEHLLSQYEVNKEFLAADRTMLHPHVSRDTIHGRIIRRELTKDLNKYGTDILEETEHALNLNWGTDENEWKEVCLYDTMLDVISRISNRVLVGRPLCRNEEYLRRSRTFLRNLVVVAGLINLTATLLRSLFSPLILAYDYYQYWRMTQHIFLVVKQRLSEMDTILEYKRKDCPDHNDFVQWALRHAYNRKEPHERTPEMVTRRLAVLNFAAIQPSVIKTTNCLFDVASSE